MTPNRKTAMGAMPGGIGTPSEPRKPLFGPQMKTKLASALEGFGRPGDLSTPEGLQGRQDRWGKVFDTSQQVYTPTPLTAVAKALTGGLAGYQQSKAQRQEDEGRQAWSDRMSKALSGGEDPMAAMADPWASAGDKTVLARMWERNNPTEAEQLDLDWKRQQMADAQKPKYQFFEQDGDQYRFDPSDPNSKPELFFDAPSVPPNYKVERTDQGLIAYDPRDPVGTAQVIEGTAPAPKPPETRTIRRGDRQVTQEWDGQKFVDVAEGDAFKTTPDTVVNTGDMKLTEEQSKSVNYYARGRAADIELSKMEKELLDLGSQTGGNVPVVGNYLKNPKYRKAERAGREILAMILRKDTGAAVTAQEFELYGPMYLPMPGDDPATVEDKRIARRQAFDAIRMAGGTAKPVFDNIDGQLGDYPAQDGEDPELDAIMQNYPPGGGGGR